MSQVKTLQNGLTFRLRKKKSSNAYSCYQSIELDIFTYFFVGYTTRLLV